MKKLKHVSKMDGIAKVDKQFIEGYCALVLIVDKSGSMYTIKTDAIGGFNSFIEEQKKVEGDAVITTVFFDSDYKIIHDWVDLADVKPITNKEYRPGGNTALNDAIARTITSIGKKIDNMEDADKPRKVVVGILTDGFENASTDYACEAGRKKIKSMIEHQQSKYSWDFYYLAANQDAILVGQSYGLLGDNISNFVATGIGTRSAYKGMSENYTLSRTCGK